MQKGLRAFEIFNPYLWAVSLRNWAYDKGLIAQCRFSVPVISVGNLSVGGSGKSSFVRHIASLLSKEFKICIVLRGYKRRTKGTLLVSEWGNLLTKWQDAGDEPYMLAKVLPKVSVLVDEDRCRGVSYALKRLKPELIILDDGFQHRRIHRDLDILLIRKKDFSDKLLPFGRLREPIKSMERADILVLSYTELENFEWKHPYKPTLRMKRVGWKIVKSSDNSILEDFRKLSFVAFSGLGDNKQFFRVLTQIGIKLERTVSFPDHYDYRDFRMGKNKFYITTLKDLVKLQPAENLFYLDFDVSVEGLKEILDNFIINRLPRVGSSAGRATDS